MEYEATVTLIKRSYEYTKLVNQINKDLSKLNVNNDNFVSMYNTILYLRALLSETDKTLQNLKEQLYNDTGTDISY